MTHVSLLDRMPRTGNRKVGINAVTAKGITSNVQKAPITTTTLRTHIVIPGLFYDFEIYGFSELTNPPGVISFQIKGEAIMGTRTKISKL